MFCRVQTNRVTELTGQRSKLRTYVCVEEAEKVRIRNPVGHEEYWVDYNMKNNQMTTKAT